MSRLSGTFKTVNFGTLSIGTNGAERNVDWPGAQIGDFVWISAGGHDYRDTVIYAHIQVADVVTVVWHRGNTDNNPANFTADVHIKVVPKDAI